MSKITEVEREIELLKEKAERLKIVERLEVIQEKALKAQATAEALEHEAKAKAYTEYERSKAYIMQIQEDLKATGVTAKDLLTGTQATVKALDDGAFRTFDTLVVGRTVEVSGRSFLVKSFAHSFGGSTAELLELNHTFNLSGKQATPYSAIPCNVSGSTLTVENRHRLSPDDVLVIGGKSFVPASIFQNSTAYAQYQLEAC